jgi:hypothetical protein
MSAEPTQYQSHEDQRRAQDLSLKRTTAPSQVPGYEIQRHLGTGAYGEVWVGVDRNTGRRVAIKFYRHRGGVDWQLLSREVEKLVFLSADRYVVQLLDVGWNAEPPYYVMEYVENGSLEDYLNERHTLPVPEAVGLFREITTGLLHAHGKGVLHCDLKPANILLDTDHKPRLADFGQSRLSHEQTPALGTLFYMAPEQADLDAVPDARWDVYALGALLYCMIVGRPPHRNEATLEQINSSVDLPDRLAKYRAAIRSAPAVTAHRKVRGMDRALAGIIDRCLAHDPAARYPNVQAVLDALQRRSEARQRLPLTVMGVVAPVLLLLIVALFGWRGYHRAIADSDAAILARAQESDRFAAQSNAISISAELERYFRAIERVANDPEFQQLVVDTVENPELAPLIEQLNDPAAMQGMDEQRAQFLHHPTREKLQARVQQLAQEDRRLQAASWLVNSADGLQIASLFEGNVMHSTLGRNYAWRTYFTGNPIDLPEDRRPPATPHVTQSHISAPFRSQATGAWKVGLSTPILRGDEFLGVMVTTVELGEFVNMPASESTQFPVLVDSRPGKYQGAILQHPLIVALRQEHGAHPPDKETQQKLDRFSEKKYRVHLTPQFDDPSFRYHDPLAQDAAGTRYQGEWIVATADVLMPQTRGAGAVAAKKSGLVVLVQEDVAAATRPSRRLAQRMAREGLWALSIVILVILALWYFVIRSVGELYTLRGDARHQRLEMSDLSSRATVTPPTSTQR